MPKITDQGTGIRDQGPGARLRVSGLRGQRHRKLACAITEPLRRDADLVEDRQEEICHRRIERVLQVAARRELTSKLSREKAVQIRMAMQVAVAHATAVENQRVIEQRAVTIRRRLQPLEEASEQLRDHSLILYGGG